MLPLVIPEQCILRQGRDQAGRRLLEARGDHLARAIRPVGVRGFALEYLDPEIARIVDILVEEVWIGFHVEPDELRAGQHDDRAPQSPEAHLLMEVLYEVVRALRVVGIEVGRPLDFDRPRI